MDWPFLLFMSAAIALYVWKQHKILNFHDKVDDEPVLTEKARVHTKSSYRYTKYSKVYYIGFYVPDRNYVVDCKVHKSIWKHLEKGDWGILCHQGGYFYSFDRDGEIICANTLRGPSTKL